MVNLRHRIYLMGCSDSSGISWDPSYAPTFGWPFLPQRVSGQYCTKDGEGEGPRPENDEKDQLDIAMDIPPCVNHVPIKASVFDFIVPLPCLIAGGWIRISWDVWHEKVSVSPVSPSHDLIWNRPKKGLEDTVCVQFKWPLSGSITLPRAFQEPTTATDRYVFGFLAFTALFWIYSGCLRFTKSHRISWTSVEQMVDIKPFKSVFVDVLILLWLQKLASQVQSHLAKMCLRQCHQQKITQERNVPITVLLKLFSWYLWGEDTSFAMWG